LTVTASGDSRPGDIPVYLSDCTKLYGLTDWRPKRDARSVLADIHTWVLANEAAIASAL
jgi:CDP-paratose 2-epimerase